MHVSCHGPGLACQPLHLSTDPPPPRGQSLHLGGHETILLFAGIMLDPEHAYVVTGLLNDLA